jgi:hypothetical protein
MYVYMYVVFILIQFLTFWTLFIVLVCPQIFIIVSQLQVFLIWGAPSDQRTGLSFARLSQQ